MNENMIEALKIIITKCPTNSTASMYAVRLLSNPNTPIAQTRYLNILQMVFANGVEFTDDERALLASVIEGGPRSGRPTTYDEAMKQFPVYLPQSQIDWLKAQPRPAGETVRSLIQTAMDADTPHE